jgi:glycosyltransferase involved in cell wall biosynthesis
MNACIYYHPEGYTITGPRLMGRNAAGASFLRGFLTYSRTSEFWVQVQKQEHAQHFAETARAFGRSTPVKVVDKQATAALAQPGMVYYPGPGIGTHAWQRAVLKPASGHAGWSLCGITHTTSSAMAMDALTEVLTAPVQTWDAIICTSHAVRDNVHRLWQAQADHLQARLGITRLVLPQTPVIPLGVHTDDFTTTATAKQQARVELGIQPHERVVLFMGRLSFHAKAHPLAMYQALEQAARHTGQSVVLVECGWHANDFIAKAYAEAATCACPSVKVVTLNGRDANDRQRAWAVADIFCSLSDNIQETFGITPIEAMAAGLPVVVSDWDGYKDTVRHGIDGFRVPTIMPQAGLATDLAARHALELDTYDMYCGHTCMLVGVDIEATTDALGQLLASPELCRQMGASGQQRAKQVYDWAVIIPQYEALWAQQQELRQAATKQSPSVPIGTALLPQPWPARMDPFHAFASYPTAVLTPETRLALATKDVEQALTWIAACRSLAMVDFAKQVLPEPDEIRLVLERLQAGECQAVDVLTAIAPERRAHVLRSLTWLMKIGVIKKNKD